MHSFKSHFSPPCNRYNNRLTVHAYTIAKSLLTVCFYWGLILEPVWCPSMLRWSTTCLASQTAGKESPQDWLVRLDIDVATFCNMQTSKQPKLSHLAINFFESEPTTTLWLPTALHLPPHRGACGND